MRRGALEAENTKPSSASDSLVNSEGRPRPGSVADGAEGETNKYGIENSSKDRGSLTREEREAKYKEARERIFKGFEESEMDDRIGWIEPTRQISRSNSRNGQNKGAGKRQRGAVDDGFEARSQFAAYYQSPPQAFHPFSGVAPHAQCLTQNPGIPTNGNDGFVRHGFPSPDLSSNGAATYPTPSQLYPESVLDNVTRSFQATSHLSPMAPTYSDALGSLQSPNDYHASPFPPVVQGAPSPSFHPSAYSQPPTPNAQWPQHSFPSPHQGEVSSNASMYSRVPDHQNLASSSMGISTGYPFGQLPNQVHPHGGHRINYQHPIPGSYNRRAFNPQIQPFVPGQRQPIGRSSSYGTQSPHVSHFPSPYQPPGHSPPIFEAATQGPHPPMIHHLASPTLSQTGRGGFRATTQSPASSTGGQRGSRPDHRPSQFNEMPQWDYPASLPAKPSSVASNMRSPNMGFPFPEHHRPPHHTTFGDVPPIATAKSSQVSTGSTSMPVRSPLGA